MSATFTTSKIRISLDQKANSDPHISSLIEKYNSSRAELLITRGKLEELTTRTQFANIAAHHKEKQLKSAREEVLKLFAENEEQRRNLEESNAKIAALSKLVEKHIGRIRDLADENIGLRDSIFQSSNFENRYITYKYIIDVSFDILTELAISLKINSADIPTVPDLILNHEKNTYNQANVEEILQKFRRILLGKISSPTVIIEEKEDDDIASTLQSSPPQEPLPKKKAGLVKKLTSIFKK